MRISSLGAYLNGLTAMQRLQVALDQTQRQIATGRRILTPSDDPIAASRALELREAVGRLEQFDRNAGIAKNRLAQEENVLGSVNNVLQRVRELALQANNATQSDETRDLIAIEMREHLDHLVQLANQRDGAGRYLFAGNRDDTEPVSRSGATFTYNGDQGQRFIQVGEGRQVADGDSGYDVFFRVRAGNGTFTTSALGTNAGTGIVGNSSVTNPVAWNRDTYTVTFLDPASYEVRDSGGTLVASGGYQSGDRIAFAGIEFGLTGQPAAGDAFRVEPSPFKDIFTAVERLASTIEQSVSDDPTRAAMANGINQGLTDLDQAIGNLLNVRTKVGSRLAVIDNQVDSNGALSLTIQETLAGIQDLDYAEALSRLSQQVTTLEAAQQSFVRTQQLTLFDYI
ncbi:MAG: flagellar hook-associated protein FlgL [Woeseiaceae bacterium]|nr:flagellar hook-associated protein FlgL [Woeseiaceae bacterium]